MGYEKGGKTVKDFRDSQDRAQARYRVARHPRLGELSDGTIARICGSDMRSVAGVRRALGIPSSHDWRRAQSKGGAIPRDELVRLARHRIECGETFVSTAQHFGVSLSALRDWMAE